MKSIIILLLSTLIEVESLSVQIFIEIIRSVNDSYAFFNPEDSSESDSFKMIIIDIVDPTTVLWEYMPNGEDRILDGTGNFCNFNKTTEGEIAIYHLRKSLGLENSTCPLKMTSRENLPWSWIEDLNLDRVFNSVADFGNFSSLEVSLTLILEGYLVAKLYLQTIY